MNKLSLIMLLMPLTMFCQEFKLTFNKTSALNYDISNQNADEIYDNINRWISKNTLYEMYLDSYIEGEYIRINVISPKAINFKNGLGGTTSLNLSYTMIFEISNSKCTLIINNISAFLNHRKEMVSDIFKKNGELKEKEYAVKIKNDVEFNINSNIKTLLDVF